MIHNSKPLVTILVAISENGVIGNNGKLPWHISDDLKRFKKITLNQPVLMGRKTYESVVNNIGGALPERENLVLTKQKNRIENAHNVHIFDNIKDVYCWLAVNQKKNLMVAGGTSIYKIFLPVADKLEITHIKKKINGDTFFPEWNQEIWHVKHGPILKDKQNELSYRFSTYSKIKF